MRTAGPLLSDTPNPDLQLFIPATQSIGFNSGTGAGTFPTATSGVEVAASEATVLDAIAVAASSSVIVKFDLAAILVRTGVLKSSNPLTWSEQAFGTANGPGPNSTLGTSDPSGMGYGEIETQNSVGNVGVIVAGSNSKAPVQKQFLPTLQGPQTLNQETNGTITITTYANTKGTRIKWVDLVYQVLGAGLTSISFQLGVFLAALSHDQQIASWAGGFAVNNLTGAALAINTAVHNVHRERCLITDVNGNATTQFMTADGTIINGEISIVTPAGSTAKVIGIVVGCDYNLN